MEVSHSFDECDLKSFERCGSTVLLGWLAGISAGELYDGTVEELGAFALGVQVSRSLCTQVSAQSGLWREPSELGRDLNTPVDMIHQQMAFHDPTLLLPSQLMKDPAQACGGRDYRLLEGQE